MKKLLIIAFLSLTSISFAQETITSAQAQENIGKEVILKGKIASFKLASNGSSTNFINIDKPYPNNVFTVVVTNKYLEEHKLDLSNSKGKEITVRGTITVYEKDPKKIPQIFNPETIEIK
jgi:exonuclease VII large subunit